MECGPQVCIEIKAHYSLINASVVPQTLQILQPEIHFREIRKYGENKCAKKLSLCKVMLNIRMCDETM